ncbi:MAG: AraC family transcriptional regulator [Clostridiaceae bacterium]
MDTLGKGIYCGYVIPLTVKNNESSLDTEMQNTRFRLIFVEKGSGVFTINKYEAFYTAPILFCLNEKDIFKIQAQTNVYSNSIYFHPQIINSAFNFENIRSHHHTFSDTEQQDCYLLFPFLQRDSLFNGQARIDDIYVPRLSRLIQQIKTELKVQRDIFWPCRSRSFFLELLVIVSNLFDAKKNIINNEAADAFVELNEIITYLQTNYNKKITINGLSRTFNINRTTLNNQFRDITDSSIIEYLINLRINMASILLRDTRLTIAEIMEKVGFNNSTHFWRMFKKHTGLSPSEYRNKYCWIKE